MTGSELYAAYGNEIPHEDFINLERDDIARRLMDEEGLDEKSAYYATDRMLEFANGQVRGGFTSA
jgi:hypothetical protein